ncbi:phage tail tip fiber protein [Klebsiella variicola]
MTAANSAQKTADATAKAVDSLTTTVSQQGDTLSSIGTRTTSLENSLRSTNDTVSKKADTTAVTQLQGTVTQQGNDIAAANSALTKLSSDLATTNANVNKKADASAMNTLQNQVTEQGKTLSAQGDSLTQLSNSLSQTAADIDASGKMPGNLIVNGSFERGAAGFTGWSSTATVADLQVPHSGNKALKMSAGQSNLVGQEISITQGRTYRMGVWAKQDPGTTIKDAGNTKFRVADSTGLLVGSNYGPFSSGWQLVTFDWKATKTTTASFQLTTFLSAGAMYFDDFHVLDVTDEKDIAANAGAISQMNTRVNANSRVDNMAKTLSDSQSTQASLNTSLQSQIDAQAAANIKNQTTLDNTIKSVASITSTQQTHATALEALATQQTTLTSSVGDLSASVQNTAKTVADVNGTVSSLWSMKVETVNGKNVGAGITLGSNGETSDMILYADRFSLFNRNNATAVPVMIAEGNELYIDTARIKNSSLTSTKIADGSITNAKIGNEIRSNNFVDGSQGWRIAKDGSSQFNNVIVRGRVEANSGVFRGTVQADAFIGDIAVAKGYDSLTFRRNQTVQRNGAYQNRGYSMTVVLACTLVCQTYGTGSGLGYTSDITFNIGGQEVTRRIFVDAGNITAGTTAFELRFAARLDADYNNVGFFIKATGRNAAIDYTCTVENITATAFRTDSSSFS